MSQIPMAGHVLDLKNQQGNIFKIVLLSEMLVGAPNFWNLRYLYPYGSCYHCAKSYQAEMNSKNVLVMVFSGGTTN
jgi:hypothetical protein